MPNENKKGSAGGKARAIIQKQKAKERIDEYNKNPKLCLYCGKPILAPYNKKLRETKIKKFCNQSCAAKHNNKGTVHNLKGFTKTSSILNNISDEEFINIFNSSDNITDFSKKLGYKYKINKNNNKSLKNRLQKLNLDINDLKKEKCEISSLTKKELFESRSNWQNARSTIQKDARKTYKESDKPKECIVCKYNKHFEVAHIKAVSDFDDNSLISEINDINNLIALCPNHHWEYDNTDFDINDYL